MNTKIKKRLLILIPALAAYVLLTYLLFLVERGHEGSSINSWPEALWYSIVTLTTVGYGDMFPVTVAGKLVGLFFLIGSVGVLGYLISQLTNQVSQFLEKKRLGLLGTKFENHILIIGWDGFAKEVVKEVIASGKQVAVVTNNKNEIDLIYETFSSKDIFALFTDYSNQEAFVKANIQKTATVFINFPDDAEVLIYVLNLKKSYPDLNYIVSLSNPSLKETFMSAGVRYVISKMEIASRLVASYMFEPDVALFAESMMTTALEGEDYDLLEYCITGNNPYKGQDCLDVFVDLKVKHDCILVGINKLQEDSQRLLIKNPSKGITVAENDYLLMICNGATKNKIERLFGVSEGRILDKNVRDSVK